MFVCGADRSQVTVAESIAVGTTVVQVAAHDQDIGDNAAITYFLSASSQLVYGDVFSVDELTGDVVVTGEVDRERAEVYHVMVGARDSGPEPLVAEATVVIKVDIKRFYYYPVPDTSGDRYCFRSISLFISFFLSFFVSKITRKRLDRFA